MPSGWCSARVSYLSLSTPGATVCCAPRQEAHSSTRQRVPGHKRPRSSPGKGFTGTVRCMTLPFALNVTVGKPLDRPLAWPDGPAFTHTAWPQTACMYSELAVVAPAFMQTAVGSAAPTAGWSPGRSRQGCTDSSEPMAGSCRSHQARANCPSIQKVRASDSLSKKMDMRSAHEPSLVREVWL